MCDAEPVVEFRGSGPVRALLEPVLDCVACRKRQKVKAEFTNDFCDLAFCVSVPTPGVYMWEM